MTAALHTLHEGGDFVDVTLAADGMQLKAHKLILSACSPYFRDILKVGGVYNYCLYVLKYSMVCF